MATAGNAPRSRKRVEATTVLKRARDGSAFTRCEACNKDVPVVLIDLHSCSLDSKIRLSLESQVVEKAVEVQEKKRKSPSAAAGAGKGKKSKASAGTDGAKKKAKRPPTAFFLFMKDFRVEFKASHPDEKGVAAVGKAAGEKWNSMTDEEKKPYVDQAKELKTQFDNGEGSAENNVGDEKEDKDAGEVDDEQEVDKPEDAPEEEEEKNELDDDI